MNFPRNITLESDDSISAIIALGANIPSSVGPPVRTLEHAKDCLAHFFLSEPLSSSFFQTEAVNCPPGTPDFINAVLVVSLSKSIQPSALLQQLQNLERECGREPGLGVNASRPLDLDIICLGHLLLSTPQLQIPHPRAHTRRFVIEPLAEIAPDLIIPGQSVSVRALLEKLPDLPRVQKIER